MARTSSMFIEITRPCLGHTVLEGLLNIEGCEVDLWEKYGGGTPFPKILRRLAAYLEALERDEQDSEVLWEQLQLPSE